MLEFLLDLNIFDYLKLLLYFVVTFITIIILSNIFVITILDKLLEYHTKKLYNMMKMNEKLKEDLTED